MHEPGRQMMLCCMCAISSTHMISMCMCTTLIKLLLLLMTITTPANCHGHKQHLDVDSWSYRNSAKLHQLLQEQGNLLHEHRHNIHVAEDPATAGISSTIIRQEIGQVKQHHWRCACMHSILCYYPTGKANALVAAHSFLEVISAYLVVAAMYVEVWHLLWLLTVQFAEPVSWYAGQHSQVSDNEWCHRLYSQTCTIHTIMTYGPAHYRQSIIVQMCSMSIFLCKAACFNI